jgi:hypothetical protein
MVLSEREERGIFKAASRSARSNEVKLLNKRNRVVGDGQGGGGQRN